MQEIISLKDYYPYLKGGKLSCLTIEGLLEGPKELKRPALIIVPGGAYLNSGLTSGECEPTAAKFLGLGYQCFILKYSVSSEKLGFPNPLLELASAIDYVYKNALKYHVNKDEIFLLGFSAGGHLVGSYSQERLNLKKEFNLDLKGEVKAIGLAYPVIKSVGEGAHLWSFDELFKYSEKEIKDKWYKRLSLDLNVNKDNLPAFIYTTFDDNEVSSLNSLDYAASLRKNNISCEMHIYPHGYHGSGIGTNEVKMHIENESKYLSLWPDECSSFFKRYCVENF